MFSRTSHLLFKRLVKSHPSKTLLQALSPTLNSPGWWSSSKTLKTFSKIQLYSFSSQQQNLRETEYQEKDFDLLNKFLQERLPENPKRTEVMKKYVKCQDLTPADQTLISEVFNDLAMAHVFSGNQDKALKYLKEDEGFNKKAGVRDTIGLASNFHLQATLYLNQNDLTASKYYLNEADRICRLLGNDQKAKNLLVQCCCALARIHEQQNDHDKALELFDLALEMADDVTDEALQDLIIDASQGIGKIYSLRNDVEKTVENWTIGLDIAIRCFGKNSHDAYKFSDMLAEFLCSQGQRQEAMPYAKYCLKIALKIFPKDDPEVAKSNARLGHIYSATNDDTKALDSFKKAIKIFAKHPLQEFSNMASSCYFQSALILASQDNLQEALKLLAKGDPLLAMAFNGEKLAGIYSKWGEELKEIGNMTEQSKTYFWKAAKIYESCKPPLDHQKLLDIHANLGNLAYLEQDWEKVCEFMKKAESYFETAELDPKSAKSIYAYISAASVRLGEVADGFKYAQKVIACYEVCGDAQHVGEAYFHFGVLHKHEGRLREALEAFKKSLEFPGMPPHGSNSRISETERKISEIENSLKVGDDRYSDKVSQILKTLKNPSPKNE